MGKPLFFQPVLYNSRYYAIRRRENAEGQSYYDTLCEGMTPCRLDAQETCSFCNRCTEGAEV